MDKTRIFIVDSDPAQLRTLEQWIHSQEDLVLVGAATTGREAVDQTAVLRPDIVLMDLQLPDLNGIQATWLITVQNPETAVILLMSETGTESLSRAMHAGAQSFLVKPLAPAKTLEAIRETHTAFRKRRQALLASLPPSGPVTPPRVRGKRIVVFGAKGGVGKTTLAVNLSVALKQITHASVMLMDADFYFGDAGIQMNLNPLHTVIDLLPASNDLDPSLLDQVMVTHKSGVQVLTGPGRPEEAEHITAQHVEDILQYLPRVFDYVIVDCSPSYDERMLRVLDQADLLLLVLTPEVGAIRNTGYFLDLAKALGYREDKIILVLNRANSNVGISMPAVENNLKQPILFKINSGGRLVALAANRGEPLVLTHPQADLSRAVFAIAQHIRKVMAPAAAG